MQKVKTFDTAFDAHRTADDRTAHVTLARAIREVLARLLKSPTGARAVDTTRTDLEARKTDQAREVALAKDTVLIALSIL